MPKAAHPSTSLHANAYVPALALALAAFLTQFDVTAVVVAMPSMRRDLGFGVAGIAWVMDAYSLAFTGTLLASGALADRHGRRRVMMAGNILFLAASLACGLAWDGPTLWASRAAQGVGAAFVITGAIALMASTYPATEDRARAFGFMGIVSGIAMATGPTLGGAISAWFGWRWIFLTNLPLCAVIAWSVPRLIAESRNVDTRPLDLVGIILMTAILSALVSSLLTIQQAPTLATMSLLGGTLLVGIFIIQQRRQVRPMLDPRVFVRPVMMGIGILLFAVSFGYWAVLIYLPLFLLAAFGWATETAGLALLAATLPMLILPPVGSRLAIRWGWRGLFACGLAVMTVGDLLLASAVAIDDYPTRLWIVFLGMAFAGTGAALAHPQLSGAVVALAPSDQVGMASALTVIARQAGFAVGIAALGAVLVSDTLMTSFMAPFALASVASGIGFWAAVALMPPAVR